MEHAGFFNAVDVSPHPPPPPPFCFPIKLYENSGGRDEGGRAAVFFASIRNVHTALALKPRLEGEGGGEIDSRA